MPDLGGLFGSFFEAAATLALLFIIIGWISSKLVEIGQAFRNSHGRMPRRELERCFGGEEAETFTRYFYWHPIIEPLTQPNVLRLPAPLRGGDEKRRPCALSSPTGAGALPARSGRYGSPESFATAFGKISTCR